MPFNAKTIPKDLIRAVINNRAVAFCGAGLSVSVKRSNSRKLPNWPQLLSELLSLAQKDKYSFSGLLTEIESAIREGKLIGVAQEIQEELSSASIAKYLREIFLDRGLKPNDIHKILVQIPWVGILTTNYDTLIEGAYTLKREGRIPAVLTQEDLDKVPNPLKLEDEFVFKIHGDINRPETIVLGSHDYQNLLFRNSAYRSFLETLFTINTVVFIGFSMSDPDVDNLLDRLAGIYSRNNDFHYLLVEKGRLNEFEKKRLALDKRIFTIEYDNADGRHGEVYEFLKHLNDVTNPSGKFRAEYERKFNYPVTIPQKTKEITAFISYAGSNKDLALQIKEIFSSAGIKLWMDDVNIQVGDVVVSAIETGIKESDYFIALITESSIQSTWIKQEIELAYYSNFERNKPKIIPIVVGAISPSKMPKLISDIQWLSVDEVNFREKVTVLAQQLKMNQPEE